jgi:hypothetical protein
MVYVAPTCALARLVAKSGRDHRIIATQYGSPYPITTGVSILPVSLVVARVPEISDDDLHRSFGVANHPDVATKCLRSGRTCRYGENKHYCTRLMVLLQKLPN